MKKFIVFYIVAAILTTGGIDYVYRNDPIGWGVEDKPPTIIVLIMAAGWPVPVIGYAIKNVLKSQ